MAVGAAYLAKQKAIVQKLTAIESLAGVDMLCSDKTGTLTANKLSVHDRTSSLFVLCIPCQTADDVQLSRWRVSTSTGCKSLSLLLPHLRLITLHRLTVAVLASSHNLKALDPIDKVTITTLKDYPKAREMLQGGWTTHKFTPFDPVSKRITSEVEKDGKQYTCAKGAPNASVSPLPHIEYALMGGF